jgi:DtxR family Mn-dependent transcriptional regulator
VISAEVEDLIRAKLDNPTTCPHGNPIPGAGAPDIDVVLLSQTQAGDTIRLERVSEELEIDHEALVYLDDHGFIPGVEGRVATVAPDQTRLVTIGGETTIAVGSSIANSLYVSLQPA